MTVLTRSEVRYRTLSTFAGTFAVIEGPGAMLRTAWLDCGDPLDLEGAVADPHLAEGLVERLRDYFAGRVVDFAGWRPRRGSPFQRRCWDACQKIGWGSTTSYADLAERAGSSRSAARAAGQAMRHNPMPVVVPCHRVIGTSGRLHGFAGSCDMEGPSLRLKAMLLDHERSRA
jgi:O-6-methylguanine DNA methyltransferase